MKRGGTLSLSNKRYIKKNFDKQTVSELAKETGKPAALIENYIKIELDSLPILDEENRSPSQEISQEQNLRSRPVWMQLCDQYTTRELNIFEEKYHSYMKQFQYDVQPTEEQQIFHMIGLEIEIDRNKASRKRNLDLKERRLKDIAKAERDEESDKKDILDWQRNISELDSATSNSMRELKDLLDRHDKLAEQLKGTRDQRLRDATSNKVSWIDIIKRLNSPEAREYEAKRIAAINQAIKKERDRLSSLHTFADGKIDSPLLNTDVVKKYEET